MGKVSVYSIAGLLFVTGTAYSAPAPGSREVLRELHASIERTTSTYHLATLPSTNKKRVDAMCVRFLSLLPKAVLIPKTEERTVFRVVAGTFDTLAAARKRAGELARHSESPFVVNDNSGYSVIAGSHTTEDQAVADQNRLAARNIVTTIREQIVPLKLWRMKSIESFPLRDAIEMAGRMTGNGVITILEPANH